MLNSNDASDAKTPHVSIIIPAYNAEKTIERCLLSVLEQSYHDWECIVINDGSIDDTGDIIHRFAGTDERIREIEQENEGVSPCRNRGLELANGEFVTFLDADDYLDQDYLEKLIKLQRQYQTDLIMCEFTNYSPDKGIEDRRDILGHDHYAEGEEASKFLSVFLWNGKKQRPGGPVCKLYKRKIIQDNEIKFNRDIHYNEDFIFNIWYFQYVNSFYYLHESLYNRLLHDSSAVHRYQKDIYIEVERLFKDYRKLRERFKWECPEERMFFLHLVTDLPFNMYICRAENRMRFKDKRKGYFAFLSKPDICDELRKITIKDCAGFKSVIKYLLLRYKQFFLLEKLYSK